MRGLGTGMTLNMAIFSYLVCAQPVSKVKLIK